MNNAGNKLRDLAGILKKGNTFSITEAVTSLRKGVPIEGAIGLLAEYYNNSTDAVIRKIIEDFFNDIRYQAAREEVIAEIRKPWKERTISMLVSSCWQSGLDYSEYITDMAKVFLEGDYSTAIECMTVIEESARYNTRKQKDVIIKMIENKAGAFTHEKNSLTLELIEILER